MAMCAPRDIPLPKTCGHTYRVDASGQLVDGASEGPPEPATHGQTEGRRRELPAPRASEAQGGGATQLVSSRRRVVAPVKSHC